MSMNYILTPDGEPKPEPNMITWARWAESADRSVAKDKVGESEISTAFLGLDHSFGGGPPLLYETMVFGGPLDGEQERYSTRDEAIEGHKDMIYRVQKAQLTAPSPPPTPGALRAQFGAPLPRPEDEPGA